MQAAHDPWQNQKYRLRFFDRRFNEYPAARAAFKRLVASGCDADELRILLLAVGGALKWQAKHASKSWAKLAGRSEADMTTLPRRIRLLATELEQVNRFLLAVPVEPLKRLRREGREPTEVERSSLQPIWRQMKRHAAALRVRLAAARKLFTKKLDLVTHQEATLINVIRHRVPSASPYPKECHFDDIATMLRALTGDENRFRLDSLRERYRRFTVSGRAPLSLVLPAEILKAIGLPSLRGIYPSTPRP